MFQQMSHFNQKYDFHIAVEGDPPRLVPKVSKKTQEITNKTLEDWSYRIEQCAHEAEDEQLGPLHSDLLDLRDEIVHLLHRNV